MAQRFDILLLDADNTLFDYDRAEADALCGALTECGLPYNQEILRAYHRINDALWKEYEKHGQGDLWACRFEKLLRFLNRTGDGTQLNRIYLQHLGEQTHLIPGALEVCKTLSQLCQLVIITNGTPQVQRRRFQLSPISEFFSHVLISGELGVQKPRREFFDKVFDLLGQPDPQRILVVGDSLTSDIAGGLGYGLASCWYNPHGLAVPEEMQIPFVIKDLQELIVIVKD